jgi:hypothetical protein
VVVGEVGPNTSCNFNALFCPTGSKDPFEHKGQFSDLSNRSRAVLRPRHQHQPDLKPRHRSGSLAVCAAFAGDSVAIPLQQKGHGEPASPNVAEVDEKANGPYNGDLSSASLH